MNFTFLIFAFAGALFVGIIVCLELGRLAGRSVLKNDPEGQHRNFGAIEGSVFGLLGLLIAFTFSGAASRYEDRRQLIAEETNRIGTAYLRVDLLPADVQPEMRILFRRYVESRLESFKNLEDSTAMSASADSATRLQSIIWNKTVEACQRMDVVSEQEKVLLLSALNDMFDIATTRKVTTETHPPLVVFFMLGLMSLVASLLAGFSMAGSKRRSLLHVIAFSLLLTFTVYVILDLEYPRRGLIRIDAADKTMLDLRDGMR
jgi:hypothetical protein